MSSALILDRDGVLLAQETGKYITRLLDVHFEIGALEAVVKLSKEFDHTIVVTNQACINKGLTTLKEVERIHGWISDAVRRRNGHIDAFYVCPHRPEENCPCRKPKNGLLLTAMEEFDIDPTKSVVVGDSNRDLEMALSLQFPFVLLKSGEGQETLDRIDLSRRMYGFSVFDTLFDFAYKLG